MPNHFEFSSDRFENLLNNVDDVHEEPANSETVVADTTGGEDLLNTTTPTEPAPTEDPDASQEPKNEDFLMSFLSEYGLRDGKVVYENEDGSTDTVDFNDLDSEEKLNILKELTTPNLTKDEIEVINYLRSNNKTIQDVIEYYSQKAVNDYIESNGPIEKKYSVDEYSDDDLYVADLKAKYTDMSEEDIKADLEIAKENEELFKKKVDIIRKQYKAREEEKAQEAIKAQEEEYNTFKSSVEDKLASFNEISMDYKDSKSDSLEISDSEKDEIYRYILDVDENGATQFLKDLNSPEKIVELAWFALYGKEAMSDISNYWKSKLKNTRKPESETQTTVVPQDKQRQRDNFTNHRKSVETMYGENLL